MSSKKIRGVTDFPVPRKIIFRTHELLSGSCTKSLKRRSTATRANRPRRQKADTASLDRRGRRCAHTG